jgi:hypothetical protein
MRDVSMLLSLGTPPLATARLALSVVHAAGIVGSAGRFESPAPHAPVVPVLLLLLELDDVLVPEADADVDVDVDDPLDFDVDDVLLPVSEVEDAADPLVDDPLCDAVPDAPLPLVALVALAFVPLAWLPLLVPPLGVEPLCELWSVLDMLVEVSPVLEPHATRIDAIAATRAAAKPT